MNEVTAYERIEINPRVCTGKPVVKGTHIPVSVILDQLAGDEAWDSILAGYPELTREDIQAAIRFAQGAVEHTDFVGSPPA